MLESRDDDIDISELLASLRRRWSWIAGGGLLGLSLGAALFLFNSHQKSASLVQSRLILDVGQGPCYTRQRKSSSSFQRLYLGTCTGEVSTTRLNLDRLAKEIFASSRDERYDYNIGVYSYDDPGVRAPSETHLVLNLSTSFDSPAEVSSKLSQVRRKITELMTAEAKAIGLNPMFGSSFITIDEPFTVVSKSPSLSRPLLLGLLGGLVVGAGSALIADRLSNRVYSQVELLRRLGHPLRLNLPSSSWSAPAVAVMVGQLASMLEQELTWQVLSIARHHEAVAPLTQMLQQQGGPTLKCKSAAPLLTDVLRLEPRNQPTGLLLVAEAGFNSSRSLDEARLLISQMSSVQAVGVVLIGVPLPKELNS